MKKYKTIIKRYKLPANAYYDVTCYVRGVTKRSAVTIELRNENNKLIREHNIPTYRDELLLNQSLGEYQAGHKLVIIATSLDNDKYCSRLLVKIEGVTTAKNYDKIILGDNV